MSEDIDIHRAFTNINTLINRVNLKGLDDLARKAFLMPILLELEEKGFSAGKKEIKEETINYLRRQK